MNSSMKNTIGKMSREKQQQRYRVSRRSVLAGLGSSAVTIPGLSIAKSNPDQELEHTISEFYSTAKEQYGQKEAKAARAIVDKNLRAKRKQGLTEQETFNAITAEISAHPDTPIGSAAIKRVQRKLNESASEDVSTQDETCGGCGGGSGTYYFDPSYGGIDKDGAYAKICEASYDTSLNRARTLVETGGYGSSYASAWLYSKYTPSSDRDVYISFDYHRTVEIGGAQIRIRGYIKPDGSGKNYTTLETLTTSRSGSKYLGDYWYLSGGRTYDIGLEITAESTSSSVEGSVADAYTLSKSRRLILNEIKVEKV